ncbi:unnamed protein product [Urochloa humidicola]
MEMEVDLPAAAGGCAHGAPPPCFDCSICLDEPAPVVTPCGHLYCLVCVRHWMRSTGLPGGRHCPVCKAAVSEGRLRPLRSRRSPSIGTKDPTRNLRGQHYCDHHWGWVLRSNAGCLIRSAAEAVFPWAFPGGRLLPVPPRPVIGDDRRRQWRVKQSLHQIWLFLAVSTLLCFLLF